jgi:predicted Kef-type K+ transport protein
MTLRASIFGPARTKTQAVVGAVVAFALALLVGLGLEQGTHSSVFTALLIGLAVLMIGLTRNDTARN